MKTNMLAILTIVVLVSGIVTAGAVISIERPDTIFDFNQTIKDNLNWRLDLGITDITKYLGETKCDIDICETSFVKKDSIDTVIEVPARYCSEWFNENSTEENPIKKCIKYIPYTTLEIKIMTDEKIKQRLLGIADAEAKRKTKSEIEINVIIDKGVKKVIK